MGSNCIILGANWLPKYEINWSPYSPFNRFIESYAAGHEGASGWNHMPTSQIFPVWAKKKSVRIAWHFVPLCNIANFIVLVEEFSNSAGEPLTNSTNTKQYIFQAVLASFGSTSYQIWQFCLCQHWASLLKTIFR